jgi:hypothetical protein
MIVRKSSSLNRSRLRRRKSRTAPTREFEPSSVVSAMSGASDPHGRTFDASKVTAETSAGLAARA